MKTANTKKYLFLKGAGIWLIIGLNGLLRTAIGNRIYEDKDRYIFIFNQSS